MKTTSLVLIVFLHFSNLPFADTNSSRELAQYLIQATGIEELYTQVALEAANNFQSEMQPTIKREITDEEKQRLVFFWYRQIKKLLPPSLIEDLLISAFTKYLTAQDIAEINRFYRTPTGKKYLQVTPIIAREAEGIGADLGQKLADEQAITRIIMELRTEFPYWFSE